MGKEQGGNDIPPFLALVLLGAVVGCLFYFSSPTTAVSQLKALDAFWDRHSVYVMGLGIAFSINCIWAYSLGSYFLGTGRQGRKLELMTGKERKNEVNGFSWMALLFGGATFITIRFFNERLLFSIPLLFSGLPKSYELNVVSGNLALTIFIIISVVDRPFIRWLKNRKSSILPQFPNVQNGIVLGTTGEDIGKPEWVTVKRKGLNGNILVTGSIGSGKTQGTILSYLDQMLHNFEPHPSILAIDPKSTFIRVGMKIIEENGLKDKILHLKLGGNVTFNPVFVKGMLKNGRFSEVAQMIRAAAANYGIKSSGDAIFWELSSYNLIKNALIYCAATQDYFTLRDLYLALIIGSENELPEKLEEALKSDKFDEEERFNIYCAKDYFSKEFGKLEDKVRTSILATATSFLNQFQEYRSQEVFCPKKEALTIHSMDEVLTNGQILLFDIKNKALARSMGTFIKLYYEQAVLNRYDNPEINDNRLAVILIDEFQDVVTVGGAGTIGDDNYLAKAREANSMMIAASPSLSTLENAIGREKAAHDLFQSFRSRIACHSTDLTTINSYKELVGQDDRIRESHSVSEHSPHPSRNLLLGGFDSKDANISESVSTTPHKEYFVTGKEFSRLGTFEAFGEIFDGVKTQFIKLFLKPYFLKVKETAHKDLSKMLEAAIAALLLFVSGTSFAFPNVCSVLKTSEARSCMDFSVSACLCPGIPPRPCAQISYYVPQTFMEVVQEPKTSFFNGLPGTALQLTGSSKIPFGIEADNDSQSFHSHSISVPLAEIPFSILPCGGNRTDKFCFDGMSEHLGSAWSTGSGDLLQPKFLAWSLSPKACLLAGAATSLIGGSESSPSEDGMSCSFPRPEIAKFPPSSHDACNGWGLFYPRSGTVTGPSQTIGALMIASRMKSLSQEVFNATPGSKDEFWQMISPQSSSCFREGQNVALLENIKNVKEMGRLEGKFKDSLFVVWSKVSCCQYFAVAAEARIEMEAILAACKGLGAL